MIKRLLMAVVLLVLVVGGIVGFNLFRDRMIAGFFAGMQPPPVTVAVTEAEAVTWRPGVEAIGTASAAQGVDLATETAGIVEEVLFSANQRIARGDLLVQIRDDVERADLAAANATLQLSRTELERARELQARGVSAVNTVETAEATSTEARSQVARLTSIMEQKALEAPFAGVIGIPAVEVGQYVEAGTAFATLQDLDTMRVDFSVPEQQIRRIRIGMSVTVTAEAGGPTFQGAITGIEPKIDPNSRLVTIRADVDNTDNGLNPGQFLQVRVALPEETGVVALPQTALSSNLYGDSVYIVRDGPPESNAEDASEASGPGEANAQETDEAQAPEAQDPGPEDAGEPAQLHVEQVFVTVGRRAFGMVEIIEGVQAGDSVVIAGQNRLSGGSPVTIDNSVTPTPGTLPSE